MSPLSLLVAFKIFAMYIGTVRSFHVIILLLATAHLHAQHFAYPSIIKSGNSIQDFIPQGWKILDVSRGDLTKDGKPDVAIVLQLKDSISFVKDLEDTVVTQPRMLLVLFKNKNNSRLVLAEKSTSFILNHDNAAMDDLFLGIAITKGVLNIKFRLFYNMGSWSVTNASYFFRYQQSMFQLIGADYFSFHRASHEYESYSYNFLTKKRSLEKGKDEKRKGSVHWKILPPAALKTFSSFPTPFTWMVEDDVVL